MIRLHHCHQTRSMRTLWLLNEIGIDFEVVVRSFDRSLRSPDYLAINPIGRIPALEIEGRALWESGAITEYLCERFPKTRLGRTIGDAERVDWLIWIHFAETLTQHGAALTQQHVVLYEDSMRSPTLMKLEAKRLAKCYAAIERRLAGRDHLLDGGFSAADISVGQALYMTRHFARLEPFERVTDWYGRITSRPAFRASLPPAGASLLYGRDFYEPWDG